MLIEIKAVQEDVEKRIEAKMEAIQSACMEALDALKVVAETPIRFFLGVFSSLTRYNQQKHKDEECE